MIDRSNVNSIDATIELDLEAGTKELVLAVLSPESERQKGRRSTVVIGPSTRGLQIKVKATDLSSFKASVTSILMLIGVILETQKTIKKELGG